MSKLPIQDPQLAKTVENPFCNGINLDIIRLEQSDFFSQWTEGKMKIRLEKPAVNNFKVYAQQNEKPGWWVLCEKLQLDFYFVYRKH